MPRRRVSVAVVPKFNALNLPGQAPSSSPIPSLPALVSMMSPAFCPFLRFPHTTAMEMMQMGTGAAGAGNFQQRLWMEVHKATQCKPCHSSETGSQTKPRWLKCTSKSAAPLNRNHRSLRGDDLKQQQQEQANFTVGCVS